ncbi:MAG: uracil-DNA glycosylase [Deltaproteobacteria bacterium]|nr:uracil-DNA glycosylase [Deltaproteobacteria bacterium]
MPPERTTILASLRDYIEQLREEGLDGLPHVNPPSATLAGTQPPTAEAAAASSGRKPARMVNSPDEKKLTVKRDEGAPQPQSPLATSANTPGELFYRYPGLEKITDLDMLRQFIGDCTRCKLAPGRTKLVFGVGNPKAELMFVGEAPGADEDLQGEPFVGRAGQLLTDIIEHGMGMSRNDVYICNVIKCRPPGNRNPEPDEVSTCEPFLFRQIDLVQPKVIVGLGTFAVQALLKVKTPISKLRGNWYEMRGIKLMPTFHPAYLLRNPADKRLVWADIQEVMKFLGRIPPQRPRR